MISVLNLLWIVPVAMFFGVLITALVSVTGDDEE